MLDVYDILVLLLVIYYEFISTRAYSTYHVAHSSIYYYL